MKNMNPPIYASDSALYVQLNKILENGQPYFLIMDDHSAKYCRELFLQKLGKSPLGEFVFISGEANKNLATLEKLYEKLLQSKISRQGLLINLGGGVVSDLGGLAAATFKRGLSFINVPTTLMAMVDAAHGGKTGINLNGVKNQIGSFYFPELVLIDTDYLRTLPFLELKSGFAEMLKHALISDAEYWHHLKVVPSVETYDHWENIIRRSVEIKTQIVQSDPGEKGERKLLNFGHTAGHSIESFLNSKGHLMSHGHAVAEGMIIESLMSFSKGFIKKEEKDEIIHVIRLFFKKPEYTDLDMPYLLELMWHDKKNTGQSINFTLLSGIGSAMINQEATAQEAGQAFQQYLELP